MRRVTSVATNFWITVILVQGYYSSQTIPSTQVLQNQRSTSNHVFSVEDEPHDDFDNPVIVNADILVDEDDPDIDQISSESTRLPRRKKHHNHHHHNHHRKKVSHEQASGGEDNYYHVIKQVNKRKAFPHKVPGNSGRDVSNPSPSAPANLSRHPPSQQTPQPPTTVSPIVPITSSPIILALAQPTALIVPILPPQTPTAPNVPPHTPKTLILPHQTPKTHSLPHQTHKPPILSHKTPKPPILPRTSKAPNLQPQKSKAATAPPRISRAHNLPPKKSPPVHKELLSKTKPKDNVLPSEEDLVFSMEGSNPNHKPMDVIVQLSNSTILSPVSKPASLLVNIPDKPTNMTKKASLGAAKHTAQKATPSRLTTTVRTTTRHTVKPKHSPMPTIRSPLPNIGFKPTVSARKEDLSSSSTQTPSSPADTSLGTCKKNIKLVDDAGYQPEAKTNLAIFRGKIMDLKNSKSNTVIAFYGISYAAPPIDNLRFKPPFPFTPDLQSQIRDGYIESTRMNPPCFPSRIGRSSTSGAAHDKDNNKHGKFDSDRRNSIIASENCLFLNIWLPEKVVLEDQPGKVTLYPVIVWIHGEGFLSGIEKEDYKSIAEFVAETEIIVVAIQYRLGVFGFLHLDSTEASGNMGLQDQVQALKWIEENIECFGGDPHTVTLMGHDMGAAFVGYHLVSKISPGYFSRAIMLGGSPVQPHMFQTSQSAFQKAMDLAKQLGCVDSISEKGIMNCLLNMDPVSIWEVQIMLLQQGHNVLAFPFVPTTDDLVLTGSPSRLLESGRGKTCEVLVGGSANEGSLVLINSVEGILAHHPTFLTLDKFTSIMRHILGTFSELPMDAILHQYKHWTNLGDGFANQVKVADAVGDYYFTCPMRKFADLWSSRGLPTYHFSFTHQSSAKNRSSWMGAVHGDELDFIFGIPIRYPNRFSSDEVELSRKMMKLLKDFIKTGTPSYEWERYGRETPNFAEFVTGAQSFYGTPNKPKHGPRLEHCDFWNDLFTYLKAASMPSGGDEGYLPGATRYDFIPSPDANATTYTNGRSPQSFNIDDNCFVALHNCSRSNFAVYVNK